MKKKEQNEKIKDLIINRAKESLGLEVQGEKEVKTPKAKAKKEKVAKTEKVNKTEKVKKEKKTVEKAKELNKVDLVESVISNREVKYIYPENCIDTLSRKKWRQSVRNKLRTLERDYLRIKDTKSKEYKAAMEAYKKYQESVLKLDIAV